ncbi:MAG: TrmH family RNA methyltransferase [bacterium]|nr:TrmH family RNA methyltransferase [bacterium]
MKNCVLILDNIRSVENAGSIFRTAEGMGVSKIYLIGTTPAPLDRFGRKRTDFSKVALGAEDLVIWEYQEKISPVIKEFKEQGFKVIAIEQSNNSLDLKNYKSPDQFALILGNEVDGIAEDILKECDDVLEIKMMGKKESLNVSVATGIAIFELLNK